MKLNLYFVPLGACSFNSNEDLLHFGQVDTAMVGPPNSEQLQNAVRTINSSLGNPALTEIGRAYAIGMRDGIICVLTDTDVEEKLSANQLDIDADNPILEQQPKGPSYVLAQTQSEPFSIARVIPHPV